MNILFNFEFLIAEIYVSLCFLLLLVYGSFYYGKNIQYSIIYSSIFSFIGYIFINLEMQSILKYYKIVNILGGVLANSFFISFIKFFIIFLSIICLIISVSFIKNQNNIMFEYPILIGFASIGMLLVASSNDFLSL
jgi:NADH:ubiquinone oxidoreductase subunit 2 (subunit N)